VPVAEGGIAATTAGPLVLSGGATRPEARGRGAYRALVRARWDEAVRRGHPTLVAQASSMSRPVLQRAGFRQVGTVTLFADRGA
jgi:predicted GNAT superfamily acetyltransferase